MINFFNQSICYIYNISRLFLLIAARRIPAGRAMNDRWAVPGKRVLKSGRIILGLHAVPCTVQSLSETGAELEVQTTFGIPSDVKFAMSNPAATGLQGCLAR